MKKLPIFLIPLILIGCTSLGDRQVNNLDSATIEKSTDSEAVATSTYFNTQTIHKYVNPDAFITAKQLKALKDSGENIVIIGTLNPLKFHQPIEGSFTLWRNDYSADKKEYPFGGMSNSVKDMDLILSNYGATQDTTIVVYSADRHHDAGRLYWQIKQVGHENVKLLDGGLNAWIAAGYPTGNANPTVEKTKYVDNTIHGNQLADLEMVEAAINNDEWVILDVRTEAEDEGEVTKNGAFGPGRIPGSVFIPWDDAVNEDTTLKTIEELKEIYGDYKDKKVIVYCQSGVRSAFTTLVIFNPIRRRSLSHPNNVICLSS